MALPGKKSICHDTKNLSTMHGLKAPEDALYRVLPLYARCTRKQHFAAGVSGAQSS